MEFLQQIEKIVDSEIEKRGLKNVDELIKQLEAETDGKRPAAEISA